MIKENLAKVHENIRKACEKAGRNPKEVTLIAVSKTKPVPMLEEAYQALWHPLRLLPCNRLSCPWTAQTYLHYQCFSALCQQIIL